MQLPSNPNIQAAQQRILTVAAPARPAVAPGGFNFNLREFVDSLTHLAFEVANHVVANKVPAGGAITAVAKPLEDAAAAAVDRVMGGDGKPATDAQPVHAPGININIPELAASIAQLLEEAVNPKRQ